MNVRLFKNIMDDLDKLNLTMAQWDQIDNIKDKIVTLLERQDEAYEETIKKLQTELETKKYQEEVHVETILQLKDKNKELYELKEKIRKDYISLNQKVNKENKSLCEIVKDLNGSR